MSETNELCGWYAVQTRSNFEKVVATELDTKGFDNYCPAFQEVHQWADRKKVLERPVFPGYVFVRFTDSPATRLCVVQTLGAVRILGTPGSVEMVPDEEIESVRRMLGSGLPCVGYPFLRTGARVRVRKGVLKNLEGILVRVKNQARLVLSVDLLSQSVATEVDVRDVEVIGPAAVN